MLPVLEERTGNTLKLLPPFDKLDKKRRNMVGQMSQFTSYMTGMTVVKENDKYNGLFLLVEGTVKVSL